MRIAIDVSGYEMGNFGIGVYIRNLVATMTQMAPNHKYLLTSFPGWHWKRRADINFPSDKYHYFRIPYIPRRVLNVLWHDWELFPVDKLVGGVDIFHGTNYEAPYVANAKKVITVFDVSWVFFPEEMRKSASYYNRWLPVNLAGADAIIVISETTKKDLLNCYEVDANKIHVIYLAPNPEVCLPANPKSVDTIKHHYGLNSPYLLAVGNLEPRKNIITLLVAYSKLKLNYPEHVLVLVGNKDRDYPRLAEYMKTAGLSDDTVIFTGYVSDEILSTLYKEASLFIYPSLYEGFGLPIVEAMASGTPVIASRVSALVEIGGDGALYFDSNDADMLAEVIERLLNDQKLRSSLRERGLVRSKFFSWEKNIEQTLAVYNKLLI